MKKFVLLLFSAIAISLQAKVSITGNHMIFMGMEIDGPIQKFTNQLRDKGFDQDYLNSEVGLRMFNGNFDGNDASVVVHYNATTNLVDNVVVAIDVPSEAKAHVMFENFITRIETKYAGNISRDAAQSNHMQEWLVVKNDAGASVGTIVVGYSADEDSGYFVTVAYNDITNIKTNSTEANSDL